MRPELRELKDPLLPVRRSCGGKTNRGGSEVDASGLDPMLRRLDIGASVSFLISMAMAAPADACCRTSVGVEAGLEAVGLREDIRDVGGRTWVRWAP